MWEKRTTIAASFDGRNNSLNALRLALATLVIVSHAWPIGGFGSDPTVGGLSLGGWAVAGFFAISGFLITKSRRDSPFSPYVWRRVLRIFPGLWFCLILTVLAFAPTAALIQNGADNLSPQSLLAYLAPNAILESGHQDIAGTLDAVPFPDAWNGSLWTLWYEFACYLVLGAVLAFSRVRKHPGMLIALFGVCLVGTGLEYEVGLDLPFRLRWAADLGSYFFAGALLCVFATRVPLSWLLAIASAFGLIVASASGHAQVLGPLPLAYLLLWLGIVLPFQRVGRKNDISYGVYIYAFPVQQLLAVMGLQALGITAFVISGIALTIPFAVASWLLVERPAMTLKRTTPPWTRLWGRVRTKRRVVRTPESPAAQNVQ